MLMKIFDAARIAAASTAIIGVLIGAVIWVVAFGFNTFGWIGVFYAGLAIFFVFAFVGNLLKA